MKPATEEDMLLRNQEEYSQIFAFLARAKYQILLKKKFT